MKKICPIILILSVFVSCKPTETGKVILSNVNVIDVINGVVIEAQDVVIEGNTIKTILDHGGTNLETDRLIDGTGKYLIPGLWDMHAHYVNFNYEQFDLLMIANGVVGIRDMWAGKNGYVIREVREAVRKGERLAPDIYASGNIIDGEPTFWPGAVGVSTPQEAREEALFQVESGVDFIKIVSGLSKESFKAIAEVANEQGIPYGGHIPRSVSLWEAMEKNMASAEHFYGLLEASSTIGDSAREANTRVSTTVLIQHFSKARFDSLCRVMAQSNLWQTPTFTADRGIAHLRDSLFTSDPRLDYFSDFLTKNWDPDTDFRFRNWTDADFREWQETYQFHLRLVKDMSEAGVKFLAGSDYPNPYTFPGFAIHDEMYLLVEGGMPELEALKAATYNPAVFMGKEKQFGSVEEGKMASLVLLNKNPLETIEHTQSIEAVILRGEVLDRQRLDGMLEKAKTNASKISVAQWLKEKLRTGESIQTALDSLDIWLSAQPDDYWYPATEINRFGYDQQNEGETATALAIFKKNVEWHPESYLAHHNYAKALMESEQYTSARDHLSRSLALNPDNQEAKVMLDSLEN